MKNVLTGCSCIDSNMSGGLSPGSIILIYGEAETGKTTLAMQCAVDCALKNYKTLFIDCDGTFSAKRLSQIALSKFDVISELLILIRPRNFSEQIAVIDNLSEYIANNFGLVVIDTLTSLYRHKAAESSGKAFGINRELNRQMAILAQTAKIKKLPIVIVRQVRSAFEDSFVSVVPVANRVLKFWADTIIALKPSETPQTIRATLEKTQGKTQEVDCYLRIDKTGIHDDIAEY